MINLEAISTTPTQTRQISCFIQNVGRWTWMSNNLSYRLLSCHSTLYFNKHSIRWLHKLMSYLSMFVFCLFNSCQRNYSRPLHYWSILKNGLNLIHDNLVNVFSFPGEGASSWTHSWVMSTVLPVGMGHRDRRGDQSETRVRMWMKTFLQNVVNGQTIHIYAESLYQSIPPHRVLTF